MTTREPWGGERIGNLRERIKLQNYVLVGVTDFNEDIFVWRNIDEVWCRHQPLKGGEKYAAWQVNAFNNAIIAIRYREDVDVTWRLVQGGTHEEDNNGYPEDVPDDDATVFGIEATRNPDERKRFLDMDVVSNA